MKSAEPTFQHRVHWKDHRRHGEHCEIIGFGRFGRDIQVRFEDGSTEILRRNALRRIPVKNELVVRNEFTE